MSAGSAGPGDLSARRANVACLCDVGYVTLPCGYTIDADGDGINMYYGAADTSVALATGSIKQILNWLDRNSSPA